MPNTIIITASVKRHANATMKGLPTASETTRLLPSALFLRGSDWDSIKFTPHESKACKLAFDNLCVLAWESDNFSSWQIESELGIIASEWAEKKKAPGKAIMRDALPDALKLYL